MREDEVNAMAKKGVDLRRYDRIAGIYDVFESPMEMMNFRKWRSILFSHLPANRDSLVLEVGVGTGKNIPYYPESRIVAIDISKKMIGKAKKRAESLGKKPDLIVADAESLPFKDKVFDIAFATFVFCSVENPVKGLEEVKRVLKDNGKAFFMEHMLPASRVARTFFHLLNPITRLFGPEINRRTDENIVNAGFKIVDQKYLLGTVFRLVVSEK